MYSQLFLALFFGNCVAFPGQDRTLSKCYSMFMARGKDCMDLDFVKGESCSFICKCDDAMEIVYEDNFLESEPGKVCYEGSLRDMIGDYDDYTSSEIIGLRHEDNPCIVTYYDLITEEEVGDSILDGEVCYDEEINLRGVCFYGECIYQEEKNRAKGGENGKASVGNSGIPSSPSRGNAKPANDFEDTGGDAENRGAEDNSTERKRTMTETTEDTGDPRETDGKGNIMKTPAQNRSEKDKGVAGRNMDNSDTNNDKADVRSSDGENGDNSEGGSGANRSDRDETKRECETEKNNFGADGNAGDRTQMEGGKGKTAENNSGAGDKGKMAKQESDAGMNNRSSHKLKRGLGEADQITQDDADDDTDSNENDEDTEDEDDEDTEDIDADDAEAEMTDEISAVDEKDGTGNIKESLDGNESPKKNGVAGKNIDNVEADDDRSDMIASDDGKEATGNNGPVPDTTKKTGQQNGTNAMQLAQGRTGSGLDGGDNEEKNVKDDDDKMKMLSEKDVTEKTTPDSGGGIENKDKIAAGENIAEKSGSDVVKGPEKNMNTGLDKEGDTDSEKNEDAGDKLKTEDKENIGSGFGMDGDKVNLENGKDTTKAKIANGKDKTGEISSSTGGSAADKSKMADGRNLSGNNGSVTDGDKINMESKKNLAGGDSSDANGNKMKTVAGENLAGGNTPATGGNGDNTKTEAVKDTAGVKGSAKDESADDKTKMMDGKSPVGGDGSSTDVGADDKTKKVSGKDTTGGKDSGIDSAIDDKTKIVNVENLNAGKDFGKSQDVGDKTKMPSGDDITEQGGAGDNTKPANGKDTSEQGSAGLGGGSGDKKADVKDVSGQNSADVVKDTSDKKDNGENVAGGNSADSNGSIEDKVKIAKEKDVAGGSGSGMDESVGDKIKAPSGQNIAGENGSGTNGNTSGDKLKMANEKDNLPADTTKATTGKENPQKETPTTDSMGNTSEISTAGKISETDGLAKNAKTAAGGKENVRLASEGGDASKTADGTSAINKDIGGDNAKDKISVSNPQVDSVKTADTKSTADTGGPLNDATKAANKNEGTAENINVATGTNRTPRVNGGNTGPAAGTADNPLKIRKRRASTTDNIAANNTKTADIADKNVNKTGDANNISEGSTSDKAVNSAINSANASATANPVGNGTDASSKTSPTVNTTDASENKTSEVTNKGIKNGTDVKDKMGLMIDATNMSDKTDYAKVNDTAKIKDNAKIDDKQPENNNASADNKNKSATDVKQMMNETNPDNMMGPAGNATQMTKEGGMNDTKGSAADANQSVKAVDVTNTTSSAADVNGTEKGADAVETKGSAAEDKQIAKGTSAGDVKGASDAATGKSGTEKNVAGADAAKSPEPKTV